MIPTSLPEVPKVCRTLDKTKTPRFITRFFPPKGTNPYQPPEYLLGGSPRADGRWGLYRNTQLHRAGAICPLDNYQGWQRDAARAFTMGGAYTATVDDKKIPPLIGPFKRIYGGRYLILTRNFNF